MNALIREAEAVTDRARVTGSELDRFAAEVLASCGVCEADAAAAAAVLGYADRRGLSTHGVINLERIYVPKLRSGDIDPRARIDAVSASAATAVLDANNGLGLTVGTRAMELCIEKAADAGVAAVVVRRSSHFGSAGYYAMRAAETGMVGIAMTNLGKQVVLPPPGGSRKLLGTNPVAAAAPAGALPPFALDMSTSVVSTGRVRAAERAGESVPAGWLVDVAGRPTTDPSALDTNGAYLQWLGGSPATGGYKGFGLGLLVEILCGVLAASGVGPRSGDESNADGVADLDVGHFFLCLDVKRFRPLADFAVSMDGVLSALLDCPSLAESQPVRYPGHPEDELARRAESGGIELPDDVAESLHRVATEFGITPPALGRSVRCQRR